MANFVRIGKERINLDTVAKTHTFNSGAVRVYFNYAISGEYRDAISATEDFNGDAANLLLAFIDQDDEIVDALYEVVNGTPQKSEPAPATEEHEVVTVLTTEQVEALGGVPVLGVCAECGDTCAPDAYYHPECVEREIAEHDDEYIEPREIVRDTRDFERYR